MMPDVSMYYMEWWLDKESGCNMPELFKAIERYAPFNVGKLEWTVPEMQTRSRVELVGRVRQFIC